MTKKVAYLSQRNTAFNEPGSVFVPQIVPVEVDSLKRLYAILGELPVICPPSLTGRDSMSLQDRSEPG